MLNESDHLFFNVVEKLRGSMDLSEFKMYILGLICYQHLSDKLLEKVVELVGESLEEYDNPEKQKSLYERLFSDPEDRNDISTMLEDALGYYLEPTHLFHTFADQAKQNKLQLNELSTALIQLSTYYDHFNGLFYDVDLQSKRLGFDDDQRKVKIEKILKEIDMIDFSSYQKNAIGDAYEYLISAFASEAGKRGGGFHTPHEVSDMVARIVTIDQEDMKYFSVYDPTMGSGSLMLNIRNYMKYPYTVKYHGQDIYLTNFNLARMNLIMHGVELENMDLRIGDTFEESWSATESYAFDSVVMNPPYSAKWSADEKFFYDSRFNRYEKLAPKSKADFAFLLHGYHYLKETGTMAIILPHGVLHRGALSLIHI